MGGEEDIAAFLQAEALMDVAGFDLGEVLVQDFGHGAAGDVGAFFGQAAVGEVAAGVFAIGHIHVGDDIDDAPVGFFGEAFVFAAVAGFHVEDGDMEAFGADDAEAAVGITEDKHGVGLDGDHQLIAFIDDIAHGGAEVFADGVEIDVGVGELEVFEEDAVQIIVVVLAGMGQQAVEILPAFVDDGGQSDDLGPGSHNNEELEFAVVFELCHNDYSTGSK